MRFYAAATGTGSKVVSLTSMEKASWRADEKRRKVGGEAPFARSMNRYYATATGTGKQRGLSALRMGRANRIVKLSKCCSN